MNIKNKKIENIILCVLSIIAIVLGILLLIGNGTSGEAGLILSKESLLGNNPILFSIILLLLGILSLIISIYGILKKNNLNKK